MGDLTKEDRIEPAPACRRRAWAAMLFVQGVMITGVAAACMDARPVAAPWSLLLDFADVPGAALVVALPDGRHHAGTGELAYAGGLDSDPAAPHREWDAFAPPEPVRAVGDGGVVGYQARYLATLRRVETAPADTGLATLRVVRAVREIGPGTLLMPCRAARMRDDRLDSADSADSADSSDSADSAAAAPASGAMSARVAGMLADGEMAGGGQVVVLDAGNMDGLRRGQPLLIRRRATAAPGSRPEYGHGDTGRSAQGPWGRQLVPMPPDRLIAKATVLAAASHIAYARIVGAIDAVRIGDDAIIAPTVPANVR